MMLVLALLLTVSGSANAFICLMAAAGKRAMPLWTYPPPWAAPRPPMGPLPPIMQRPVGSTTRPTTRTPRPPRSQHGIWRPVD